MENAFFWRAAVAWKKKSLYIIIQHRRALHRLEMLLSGVCLRTPRLWQWLQLQSGAVRSIIHRIQRFRADSEAPAKVLVNRKPDGYF